MLVGDTTHTIINIATTPSPRPQYIHKQKRKYICSLPIFISLPASSVAPAARLFQGLVERPVAAVCSYTPVLAEKPGGRHTEGSCAGRSASPSLRSAIIMVTSFRAPAGAERQPVEREISYDRGLRLR